MILIEHVMRFLVGLSDQVMIINYGEKLYQGPAEGLAKDRQVVDVYLGEGTSARLGIVSENKRRPKSSTTTSVPDGDAEPHSPRMGRTKNPHPRPDTLPSKIATEISTNVMQGIVRQALLVRRVT